MTTTTTVITHIIDLSPLIDQVVIPALSAALLAILSWVAAYVVKFFKIKITAQQGAVVDAALANGINLAVHQLQAPLDANSSIEVKNQAIAIAANYAIPKIVSETKALGITPASITQRIEARLPIVAPPSAPPVGNV